MQPISTLGSYSSTSSPEINQEINQPEKVRFSSGQRLVQSSSNDRTVGLQKGDQFNLEGAHQIKKPSTAITPDSESIELENIESTRLETNQLLESNIRSATPERIESLKNELTSVINNLPDPEGNINNKDELLKQIAQNALSVLEEIDFDNQGKLTCKSPCDIAASLAWEVPVCLLFYVGATINLAVFVGTAEDGEKLNKALLALGASLSTGPMYMKGLLAILDQAAATRANNNSNTESKFDRLAEMVTPLFNEPVKAVKGLSIAAISAMSVYLDAKNTVNGVTRLTGMPNLGLALGAFNGLTEALLPMVQLDETWKAIADPFTALVRGSTFTKSELTSLARQIKPIVEKFESDELKEYMGELPEKERESLKNLMGQLANNNKKVRTELSRRLAGESISSSESRTHNLLMFLLQLTAMGATGTFVAGAMSIPEKFGFYTDQMKNCSTTIPPHLQQNISSISFNQTSNPSIDLCDITAYPMAENTLNHLSYLFMSLGLYPCFLNSFDTAKKTVKMAADLMFHGKFPSMKDVASVSIGALSATCYAMIIMGVRGAISEVQTIEGDNNYNTNLIEPTETFIGIAIAAIVLTLFGGSAGGVEAILDRGERRLFDRTTNSHDGVKIVEVTDEEAERFLEDTV